MDSVSAKAQQLQTSLQSLYTEGGFEELYKIILDLANNVVSYFNSLPKLFGKIPAAAITIFTQIFAGLSATVRTVFKTLEKQFATTRADLETHLKGAQNTSEGATNSIAQGWNKVTDAVNNASNAVNNFATTSTNAANSSTQASQQTFFANGIDLVRRPGAGSDLAVAAKAKAEALRNKKNNTNVTTTTNSEVPVVTGPTKEQAQQQVSNWDKITSGAKRYSSVLSGVGVGMQMISMLFDQTTSSGKKLSTVFNLLGGTLATIGYAASGNVFMAVLTGINTAVQFASNITKSTEEKIKELKDNVEDATNKALQSKDEIKTLDDYKKKWEELSKVQNKDSESRQEWLDLNNEIVAKYPELLSYIDTEGNKIASLGDAYDALRDQKANAYKNDFIEQAKAEIKAANDLDYVLDQLDLEELQPSNALTNIGAQGSIISENVLNGGNWQDNIPKFGEISNGQTVDIGELFNEITLWNADDIKAQNDALIDLGKGNLGGGHIDNEYMDEARRIIVDNVFNGLENGFSKDKIEENVSKKLAAHGAPDDSFLLNPDHYQAYSQLFGVSDYVAQEPNRVIETINKQGVDQAINFNGLESPSQIILDAVNDTVQKEWNDFDTSQFADPSEAWSNFFTSNLLNGIETKVNDASESLYGDLGQKAIDGIDALYNSLDQYAGSIDEQGNLQGDIVKAITDIAGEDSDALIERFASKWKQDIETAKAKFIDYLSNIQDSEGNTVELDEEVINSLADSIPKAYQDAVNQVLSDLALSSPEAVAGAANFINSNIANNDELSRDQKNQALEILSTADLTSLNGIYAVQDSLNAVQKGLGDSLLTIADSLNINLVTEIESFISSYAGQIEDFDKAIASAEKGMDAKTASEMAAKMGKSVSDFEMRDGKFYANAVDIRDAYLKYNEELYTQLNNDQTEILDYLDTAADRNWENVTYPIAALGNKRQNAEINKLLDQYKADTSPDKGTFAKYVKKQFETQQKSWDALNSYTERGVNSYALSVGDFETFVQGVLGTSEGQDFSDAVEALKNSDLQTLLTQERFSSFSEYAEQLYSVLGTVQATVFDSVIDGLGKSSFIKKDDFNAEILKILAESDTGVVTELTNDAGEVYGYVVNEVEGGIEEIRTAILNSNLSDAEKADELVKLHNKEYEHNTSTAFEAISGSYDKIGYEAASDLMLALGKDASELDKYAQDNAGNIIMSYTQYTRLLRQALRSGQITIDEYNKYLGEALDYRNSQSDVATGLDLVKNMDALTNEELAEISKRFNIPLTELKMMLDRNADGTYKADISDVLEIIKNGSQSVQDAVLESLGSEIQTLFDSIQQASEMSITGTTDVSKMQQFTKDYNTVTGESANMQDLYSWNETQQAFVLSQEAYNKFVNDQIQTMIDSGIDPTFINRMLEVYREKPLLDNIDVMSYLDSEDLNGKAAEKLTTAISDYYQSLGTSVETANSIAEKDVENLQNGGRLAVATAQKYARKKGEELSSADVEKAYRSQMAQYDAAFDQLEYSTGAIITEQAYQIMHAAGYEAHKIGNNSYVIDSMGNVADAYAEYLRRISESGEATAVEINEAAAQYLAHQDNQVDAISALGDAASMTYARLGEILSAKGMDLLTTWQQMVSSGIAESIGGDKLRIIDFNAFADMMDWAEGSEEYISAFKTYNDSMIELNRKVEGNIKEEVGKILEAKPGDQVNLTSTLMELNDDVAAAITAKILEFGGQLNDSILTIGKNTNIIGIAQAISDIGAEKDIFLEDSVAELADQIQEVIASFAEAINKGITGELTNVEALDLENFAKVNLGIDPEELDFHETSEGLKLSQQSAILLYTELKKVDALQASLVFDQLNESLQDSNGYYHDVSTTLARIKKLQDKINGANGKVNSARRQEYERELAVAEEILRVRSTSDPESFDFMNRDMPDMFNAPINYWNATGEAYKAMNEASQSGYMEIQDFYNIVNEMNSMAAASGETLMFMGQQLDGSAEAAAALIESGFSALTNVDGEGVKIALNNLGVDLTSGAESMSSGFDTGIKEMARAQIKMIDAAINMLEAIVAMEDIDIDQDGLIEMPELFKNGENADDGFTEQAENWFDQIDALTGGIEIAGMSLREAIASLEPEKAVEVMNQLMHIDIKDPINAIQEIYDLIGLYFPGMDITKGKESIFDILKIPKNADRDSKEFQDWIKEKELDADAVERLIGQLKQGGSIGSIDSDNTRLVEQIMDLTDGQKKVFEKFASQNKNDHWVDSEEITTFSNIEVTSELDSKGEAKGTYTASDGSTHDLSGDPSSWMSSVQEIENTIEKQSIMGAGTTTETAAGAELTSVTLSNGVSVDGVVEATDKTVTAYYNGQSHTFAGSGAQARQLANAWIRQQAEQSITDPNVGLNTEGPIETESGTIQYKSLVNVEGEVTVETAQNLAKLTREQIEEKVTAANKTEPITIEGLTFEAGTTTEQIQQFIQDVTGTETFAQLPQQIAAGIAEAFAGTDLATQIGTAIGTAIANANIASEGEQADTDLATGITNGASTLTTTATIAGRYVPEGLAAGIKSGQILATAAAAALGIATINSLKSGLSEASPSTTAKEAGSNVAIGLANGMSEDTIASTAATTLGTSVITSLQTVLGNKEWAIDLNSVLANVSDVTIGEIANAHYDATLTLTQDIANGQANVTNMTVGATNITAGAGLAALQNMSFGTTSQGLSTIQTRVNRIDSADFSNFSTLNDQLSAAADQANSVWEAVQKFANQTFTVTLNQTNGPTGGDSGGSSGGGSSSGGNSGGSNDGGSISTPTIDTSSMSAASSAMAGIVAACSGALTAMSTKISTLSGIVGKFPNKAGLVSSLASAMGKIPSVSSRVSNLASEMGKIPSTAASRVSNLATAMGKIPTSKNISITATVSVSAVGGKLESQSPAKGTKIDISKAKGNVSLASGRKTLMGELGPELVVTNGHYYLVGQNGPEMVNLASDAIVFNHKQTADLLTKKRTSQHGKPVTNENNAISWATGNVSGPAMASASAALAALKELRAMWQALLDASAKDLGSKAGLGKGGGGGGPGGGGGGGGGGGDGENTDAYIHDLQIWYNLLRQIEHIEMHISEEEKHQSAIESARVANGYEMYDSMQKQLDLIEEQIKKEEELGDLQRYYYNQRAKELRESDFGNIFTFDEDGLMQYADSLDEWIAKRTQSSGNGWSFKDNKLHITGKGYKYNEEGEATGKYNQKYNLTIDAPKSGLDFLAMLNATDTKGKPMYTADQQVQILKAYGLYDEVQYDSSGKKIDLSQKGAALQVMQNFWDKVDGYIDEMDELYDSVHETEEKKYELDAERNEILQKMVDNEISIENDLLAAIEAREQAEIDRLTDEKDALQEATEKFIDGLNDQLDRERQMYENQQSDTELAKLQRQLAILQRSGGSASQIRSLQDQIAQKSQDQYFQKQQDQIDAVQAASDKQVQQMEEQIELMEETLEYQKENGLLWTEVRDIMQRNPTDIVSLLSQWDPELRSASALQRNETLNDILFRLQQFAAARDEDKINAAWDELTAKYGDENTGVGGGGHILSEDVHNKAHEIFDQTYQATGSVEQAKAAAQKYYDEEVANIGSSGDSGADEDENKTKISTTVFFKMTAAKALPITENPGEKSSTNKLIKTIKASKAKKGAKYTYDDEQDGYIHLISGPGVPEGGGWTKWRPKKMKITGQTKEGEISVGSFDTGGYTGQWGTSGRVAMLHEKELVLNKDDTSNLLQAINTLHDLYKNIDTNTKLSFDTAPQAWADILNEMYAQYQAFRNEAVGLTNSGSVVINEANVNVNVPAVANDYDSRRIGSIAMDEMVKIARKTGVKLNRR